MDDEECSYVALQEPLYRVETGNYEYRYVFNSLFLFRIKKRFISLSRLILRCRQLARERFAKMRADVLVKLELLDQKHGLFLLKIFPLFLSILFFLLVQDIVFQLHRFITALDKYHKDCNDVMKEADIFPIEVDLTLPTLRGIGNPDTDDEDDEANGDDLLNDDQQEIISNQHQTVKDFDLLNIGQ